MFLADGLEECEALITVDILRRGGVEVVTASIKDEVTIHSSHGITFEADSLAKYLSYVDFDMVILPGGHQGTMNLKASPLVEKVLIDYAADETKKVAAICRAFWETFICWKAKERPVSRVLNSIFSARNIPERR